MKSEKKILRSPDKEVAKSVGKKTVSDDVYAAIAMALYELSEEAHDIESGVLTLKENSQPYSPWNVKYATFRQMPERKII